MFLLGLFILIAILIKLNEPKIKGHIGEKAVVNRLSRLPENKYTVINNLMLRTDYGTTQIDHIVVSIYGIFVIETKNYSGWITGGEFSEEWTKNMYGKKYKFRNPLKQNYSHVKALENKLKITSDKFIPIVAFSASGTIKVNTSKPVVYINQLKKEIEGYTELKLREEDIPTIVSKIRNADVTTKETAKEHIKEIQTKVSDKNVKIKNNICPKCGGNLVKRKGKYGEFLGCSNFPKCRYTVKC